MNSEISRLTNLLAQAETDFKVQYQALRANFNQAEQQNANLTNILEQKHREYTQNIELLAQELNREKEISQMANGLNTEYQKSVEIIQAKQNELVEISKKLKDYEFQVGQKTAEINRLKLLDEDYEKLLENEKKKTQFLQDQLKSLEVKHASDINEQTKSYQKKKEKMELELEAMRVKVKEFENALTEIKELHQKDKEE